MLVGVGWHLYDIARRATRGDTESIEDRGSETASMVSSRAASSTGSVAEGAMIAKIERLLTISLGLGEFLMF
jgi:hypothetical protein